MSQWQGPDEGRPVDDPVQHPLPQPVQQAGQQAGQSSAPPQPWGGAGPAGAPQPGIVPLRPLGLGEIWDGGFRAYRQNPRVMLGLSAVVVVIAALFQLAGALVVGRDLIGASASLETGATDGSEVFGALQRSLPVLLAGSVLQVVAILVLNGLLIVSVSRAVLGRTTTLTELWTACRGRLPALLGLSLLVTAAPLAVGALTLAPGVVVLVLNGTSGDTPLVVAGVVASLVGVLAWAVGGTYLWVKWSLATPAMLLEKLGIFASLRRSWTLTKRSFWRLLGILLLTSLVVTAVIAAVGTPFQLLGALVAGLAGIEDAQSAYVLSQVLTTLGTVLGSLVGYPFLAAVTALLYVDLRMRREGLDVELHRAAGG